LAATDFFSTPGGVAVITGSALPVLSLSFQDWGGYGNYRAVITSLSVQFEGGRQFLHTLEDMIFLYVFGERMGEMTISGVCFSDVCAGATPGELGRVGHGAERVLGHYVGHRVTFRAEPVLVAFGVDTAFECFLTGVGVAINDPEKGLGQFTYRLSVVPPATFDVEAVILT